MKLGQPLSTYLPGTATRVERGGALCARLDGFDLHGQLAFGAGERARIERLMRYSLLSTFRVDRDREYPLHGAV
jgi:hypothetical protein